MIKRFKSTNIITENGLFDGYVYIENGKIIAVTKDDLAFDSQYDFGDDYISPGFVDLHVHGAMGYNFGFCDENEAEKAVYHHLTHGTTTIMPTLSSERFEKTVDALDNLRTFIKSGKSKANISGVHIEGPYFSKNQCGAQNTDFITPPVKEDYTYIISNYGDIVKRWSFAPELDFDGEFCKDLSDAGIIASAGHTDATYADMEKSREKGLSLITHLFSCTSTIVREKGFRIAGVNEYAFSEDIAAEIIADGCHLPKELIRMVYKIKGRENVMLITDAVSVCGSEQKTGSLNGVEFIVEDGVCKLYDRSAFAGSIATTDVLVRNCIKSGISVVDSVYMASTAPAKLVGLSKGLLEKGYDADILVFDRGVNIKEVYVAGEKVC